MKNLILGAVAAVVLFGSALSLSACENCGGKGKDRQPKLKGKMGDVIADKKFNKASKQRDREAKRAARCN